MNAQQIFNTIQSNRHYSYFGIRAVTQNPITGKYDRYHVGDGAKNSYHWDDGDSTSAEINGTCAIKVSVDAGINQINSALNRLSAYVAKEMVLIGANGCDYGDDDDEIILRDGEILATWKR